MDLQLTDSLSLVTGSTAGIGKAIAARLLREGARVVVNGRSEAGVEKALAELRPLARSAAHLSGVAADAGTPEGAAAIVAAAPGVEILVNNSGYYEPIAFEEITDAQWTAIFEGNVMSGVRLSRAYLPAMLKRGTGRIVFISSESGVNTPSEMIHYGMTKTAQLAISRGLAQRCVGTRVTVNSILVGPTWSEGVERFVGEAAAAQGVSREQFEKEFFTSFRGTSLIKRFMTVDEVADTTAFIASPLASATNGAAVRCEGGIISTIA